MKAITWRTVMINVTKVEHNDVTKEKVGEYISVNYLYDTNGLDQRDIEVKDKGLQDDPGEIW
eukprot:14404176-Heterocapsa_arctica.AAC.1